MLSIRRIAFAGVVALTGTAALAIPVPVRAQSVNGVAFAVGKSINLSAGWNRVRYSLPNDQGVVLDPPYIRGQDWTDEEKPEDFAYVKQLGFTSVRFMVEPTPFVQFSGARLDALYRELDSTIQQIQGAGLNVIVDLHTVYPARLGFVDSGNQTPAYLSYRSMVGRMGTLVSKYGPTRVALELQNEPKDFSCSPGVGWNAYQPDLLRSARASAPQTTIILTGGCGGGIEGLLNVDAAVLIDPNTLFSFHYYNSLLFTHQGANWTGFEYFVRELRYPSTKNGTFDSIWLPTKSRIEVSPLGADKKTQMLTQGKDWLAFHMSKGFNRSTIDTDMQRVTSWAQRNGVPTNRIFMGEFGVIRPKRTDTADVWRPYADDRVEWHADVRKSAEAAGFSWAMFSYMGNFGMLSSRDLLPGTPRIAEVALVSALGLGPTVSPPLPTTTTSTTIALTTTTTTIAPTTTSTTIAPTTTTTSTTAQPPQTTTTVAANNQPLNGRIARLLSTCNKNMGIDVKGWSKEPGGAIQLYWNNDQANQRFIFRGVAQDRYQLISEHSGLLLGASSDQIGAAATQEALSASSNVWKVVGRPNNVAEFRRASNEALTLDVVGGLTAPSTPLQLAAVTGSCSQKFTLIWMN
jgi:endoglucanase